MDAEDMLRRLRREIETRKGSSLAKLLATAADSEDAAVRAAWAEYRTLDEVAKELRGKKEE